MKRQYWCLYFGINIKCSIKHLLFNKYMEICRKIDQEGNIFNIKTSKNAIERHGPPFYHSTSLCLLQLFL